MKGLALLLIAAFSAATLAHAAPTTIPREGLQTNQIPPDLPRPQIQAGDPAVLASGVLFANPGDRIDLDRGIITRSASADIRLDATKPRTFRPINGGRIMWHPQAPPFTYTSCSVLTAARTVSPPPAGGSLNLLCMRTNDGNRVSLALVFHGPPTEPLRIEYTTFVR
jgi:hypothetical protein